MASQDWVEKDFYKILGVAKDVPDAELKKVYEDVKALNSTKSTMNPEVNVERSAWKTTAKKVVDAIDDYSY